MKVEIFHDYRWHRIVATVEDYPEFYYTERTANTLGGLTIDEHRRMMAV